VNLQIQRKFRVIADIVERVGDELVTFEDLQKSMTQTGELNTSELESLLLLATELGFLVADDQERYATTKTGRSFDRYMTDLDKVEFDEMPDIDRGTVLRLCVTVPPPWSRQMKGLFLDLITDTLDAQRTVADEAKKELLIISPFIDVAVFQLALKDLQKKEVDLTVITSEPALRKQYTGGVNFELKKLEGLIRSRFRSGRVYFLKEETTIAHAKVWCSDRSVLVTSANIKSDSTTDNLEVGIYTDDPELLAVMRDFALRFLRLGGLRCILNVT
jgi:phosphatidylserine/phosphatidylglycerophosphate/cardiolipin synthase-like enzyme